MKKIIFALLIACLLPACTTVGEPFERYPSIDAGKGQLIIFNAKKDDVKLLMPVIVSCNDKPCGKILYKYDSTVNGLYTVQNLPEGVIKVSIKNNLNWTLGPKISIRANELNVNIQSGRRTVVMATLISGSETYYGNTLSTASHNYVLQEIAEESALPLLRGLKQPARF